VQGAFLIGAASLALAAITAIECRSILHLPSVFYGLFLWVWWGIVASTLWLTSLRVGPASSRIPSRAAIQVVIASTLGFAHLILLGSLGLFVPEWHTANPPLRILMSNVNLNRFGMELLIYGFIFGLIGIIQAQFRAHDDALQSLELHRQLAAAQLKALQMQLEPHFLLNTLNAITTLVELGRQAEAAEMLGHLNVILKRTLQRSTPEKVPLSQELEVVENYLAIEQVRFADRLRVDFNVDPSALHSLVPCFLLQPIVENSIRHGIARCEGKGLVVATARRKGNRLEIQVRDTGSSSDVSNAGNGIGLKNTRERLDYFYPAQHAFRAGPLSSGGYEVVIDLPFETAG